MIEAQGLNMYYGSFPAVRDLSFSVSKGEILGLLGPNGAGKTTVLRILSTQLVPTRGTARLNGVDILQEPQKARSFLGYLPENPPLYNDMEVKEYLDFVARARGLAASERKKRLEWVTETCQLAPVFFKPIGTLSKGYRQRVGLAQALIHDPPILILDEPTSGLDPLQITEVRRLIQELASEKAIIFSSHILQEVEALAHRILILNQGRQVAYGTQEEIYAQVYPQPVYRIRLKERPPQELTPFPGVKEVRALSEREYQLVVEGTPSEVLCRLCAEGLKVEEAFRETLSLEEIFLQLVEEKDAGSRDRLS